MIMAYGNLLETGILFCEREFSDGHPYCNLEDAKNNLAGLMAFRPIHYCDGGHIGIGYFTGLERVDKDE